MDQMDGMLFAGLTHEDQLTLIFGRFFRFVGVQGIDARHTGVREGICCCDEGMDGDESGVRTKSTLWRK